MPWRSNEPTGVDGLPLHFEDRTEAGRRLARLLEHLREEHPVVLGLPRGGVPVAEQVASYLDAALDVIVVRKLGVPWQPELAMGAIGEGEARVVNEEVAGALGLTESHIQEVEESERRELVRRVEAFRADREPLPLAGRTAVIVDDGVATGSTAQAACAVARVRGASRIVVAVPVASPPAVKLLSECADEVVCLGTPDDFGAIGVFYRDFTQTSDDEVRHILERRPG